MDKLNFLDPTPPASPPPKPPSYEADSVQAILNWQQDPALFVEQAMDVDYIEEWQREALATLITPGDLAIRSGHGVGKSAFLAWVIIWWMLLKPEPRIACTAPTGHQLEDVLWGEIAQWTKKLPEALQQEMIVKNERVEATRNPKRFYCVARTARKDQPEAFQGFHAPDMLFIADEASGVDDIIFQEFKGTGNMDLVLSRECAEQRIWPAIHINDSGTRKEHLLLTDQEYREVTEIRRALADKKRIPALKTLMDHIVNRSQ